ncbi:MAG: thiamine pyrophosphate-binding protein [Cellvibrionaceae bacterium]
MTNKLQSPVQSGSVPSTTMADLLISYLRELEVEYIFGIPGGAIEPLYNALARSERRADGGPRAITVRHETGGAFMADGYYCQTGKIGVCCATTGPGTTNIITGVASAHANHIPMLVLTGQTALNSFGKQAFQESSCTGVNTLAILEPCTRYNTLVSHPGQFELKLVTALMAAMGPNPGPVHLSVPIDVMNAPHPDARPQYNIKQLLPSMLSVESSLVGNLVDRLKQANKIVFVVGEGGRHAIGDIIIAAQLLEADIVTTPQGKGLLSPYHPLYRGVIGFAGHQSAARALLNEEVDTVVCIGAALSEWATNAWDSSTLMNQRLIHIDQQEHNFALTPMAGMHVRGSIAHTFERLLAALTEDEAIAARRELIVDPQPREQWSFTLDDPESFQSNTSPIHPARVMCELPKFFPRNTRYVAEPGNSFAWAIHYLHPYDQRIKGSRDFGSSLFKTWIEFASMGWAIGSAVGAALALKDQPVVCITGDGSMLMSGQEITVAIEHNLPLIYIVLNDMALGMVKHGQRLTGAEQIAWKIPEVDFASVAKAMGAKALRVERASDFEQLKNFDLHNLDGPILLDVIIDGEAVPPITKRTEALKEMVVLGI